MPDFKPDPSILKELDIGESEILVTVRPPATEAHYHNPASEELFAAAINLPRPRGKRQNAAVAAKRATGLFYSGRMAGFV